jgi:hypothetical protein
MSSIENIHYGKSVQAFHIKEQRKLPVSLADGVCFVPLDSL